MKIVNSKGEFVRIVVYDCEIIKAVPGNERRSDYYHYCKDWSDYKGMGISCIGAYDYAADRYRVFLQDNFCAFQALLNEVDLLVGFNNNTFDNRLIIANGFTFNSRTLSYDLLQEIRVAAGWRTGQPFPSGFKLDLVAKANFQLGKTGDGGNAAFEWQDKKYGSVIDYCLMDVKLTKMLFDKIDDNCTLLDPRSVMNTLKLVHPSQFIKMNTPPAERRQLELF